MSLKIVKAERRASRITVHKDFKGPFLTAAVEPTQDSEPTQGVPRGPVDHRGARYDSSGSEARTGSTGSSHLELRPLCNAGIASSANRNQGFTGPSIYLLNDWGHENHHAQQAWVSVLGRPSLSNLCKLPGPSRGNETHDL